MQHVFRTKGSPNGKKAVMFVRQKTTASDGNQPGITRDNKDHCRIMS
jgi:hypothetical protein